VIQPGWTARLGCGGYCQVGIRRDPAKLGLGGGGGGFNTRLEYEKIMPRWDVEKHD
jgi:hypothetical protein